MDVKRSPVFWVSPNSEKRRRGAVFALVGLDLADSLLLLRDWKSKKDSVVVDLLAYSYRMHHLNYPKHHSCISGVCVCTYAYI